MNLLQIRQNLYPKSREKSENAKITTLYNSNIKVLIVGHFCEV